MVPSSQGVASKNVLGAFRINNVIGLKKAKAGFTNLPATGVKPVEDRAREMTSIKTWTSENVLKIWIRRRRALLC